MNIRHQQNVDRYLGPLTRVGLLLLTVSAVFLPSVVLAHGDEESESWIDFSHYGFSGLTKLFNVHPVFVHFPIALLPLVLLFFALGIWLKWPSLLIAGRTTLYLACASVIIAVLTGNAAMESFPHNEVIHRMMETHQHTGYVILGLTVLLTAWSFWQRANVPRGSLAFLLVAAVATYFVLQTADIGGRMVYLEGAAVKPMVPLMEEGHQHEHKSP
ncbi:MAG: DUF2231 domain-containing protein [Chthoniobacterales bacterium]